MRLLPDYVIESAFKEHDLRYVQDNNIPESLKEKGWSTKNYIKDLENGSYICVHLIYGPDGTGMSVVKRNDRVLIEAKQVDDNNYTFTSKWIDQEITENSDICDDFFNQIH